MEGKLQIFRWILLNNILSVRSNRKVSQLHCWKYMGPWVCTHRSSHGGVTVSFQNEVSMLKNEVAQLKQLLLTHKDCPITAMQKESQGYLSKSLAFWLLFFFFKCLILFVLILHWILLKEQKEGVDSHPGRYHSRILDGCQIVPPGRILYFFPTPIHHHAHYLLIICAKLSLAFHVIKFYQIPVVWPVGTWPAGAQLPVG